MAKKARTRTTKPPPATTKAPAAPDLAKAFRQELRAAPPAPSSTVVTLDPDVAPHFPTSRAVNEALRALLRIVKQVRL